MQAPGPFKDQNNYLTEEEIDDEQLSNLYRFATDNG